MNDNAVFSVKLFNDAVVGFVLAHSARLGILDEIDRCGQIQAKIFCISKKLNLRAVNRLLNVLRSASVIHADSNGVWKPGPRFKEAYKNLGYFEWLFLGYGGLLVRSNIGNVCEDEPSSGRNGMEVAAASARIGKYYVDETLNKVIDSQRFDSVIDLGCGGAARLIEIANRHPAIRATGIEIDQGTVTLATESVKQKQLQNRISILQADVRLLSYQLCQNLPQDLVMMNFMGHDMWPIENALKVFTTLRECFPKCKRFLLADTLSSGWDGTAAAGIFTVGFELIHEVLEKYIPTEAEWMNLLPRAGWTVRRITPLDVPYSQVFELIPTEPRSSAPLTDQRLDTTL